MILTNSDLAESLQNTGREELLNSASFFFKSPGHVLLAKGMYAVLSGRSRLDTLSEQISLLHDVAQRAELKDRIVVGAIPFDSSSDEKSNPVYLGVPEQFIRCDNLTLKPAVRSKPKSTEAQVSMVPEPEIYKNTVCEALMRFEKRELDKVVLSRTLEVTGVPVSVSEVLSNLAASNNQGYTFGIQIPNRNQQQPATLVGASPELLVARSGLTVTANPLAGSAARSSDPEEDQRRAQALLNSAKDLHEHAVVIDAVATALAPYCKDFKVPAGPSLIKTETMWHLSTVIEGTLIDPQVTSLELAAALHPTPAVCGYPTNRARQFIKEQEPFDRGFFTGMVGWCDAEGNGEWVVTIRCAEITAEKIRLYAGAGVVKGSNPDKELAETGAKFKTMLDALGLNGQSVDVVTPTSEQTAEVSQ